METHASFQGNDGFRFEQAAWGEVLVCEPLAAVAPHLFSTRSLVAGRTPGDMISAYKRLAKFLGVDPTCLHDADQVHGAEVCRAVSASRPHIPRPKADILLTNEPGAVVTIRIADCVPVLLADPRSRSVAAVHAGWRGTRAGAVGRAVSALTREFGARPEDVVAALGPSIGPCCYHVGSEVRRAFDDAAESLPPVGDWFAPDGERWILDLWKANREQLLCAGVPDGAIHVCRHCTSCMADRYHSYRREGTRAGRLFAAIRPASPAVDAREAAR